MVSRLGNPNNVALQETISLFKEIGSGYKSRWSLTNLQWTSMMHLTHDEFKKCNRWSTNADTIHWICIWKKVRESSSFNKIRIMVWRIVQHGFFIGSRALKFTVSDGICSRCKEGIEDIRHLFFTCDYNRQRWMELAHELRRSSFEGYFDDLTPWSIFQRVIGSVQRNVVQLFVFVEMITTLWDKRNKLQFLGKRIITLLRVIVQYALFNGKAFVEELRSLKKVALFKTGLAEDLKEVTNKLLHLPQLENVKQTAN